jgi:predicted naringenin-chalcone synthase
MSIFSPLSPPQTAERLSTRVGISGLGTCLPPLRLSQEESLAFILSHFNVKEPTKVLYKRVFQNKAVRHRHFALEKIEEVLETDHDKINARFEKWAADLSSTALQRAARDAGVPLPEIDFVAVTTCTGYICPGISAHLVERCGLRSDMRAVDIVGMGCGAAIPALEQAHNFLRANPGATAAVVSTEICSAAMYSDDAPDLVISNALFSDGSAAVILRPGGHDSSGPGTNRKNFPHILGFESLTIPEWRDTLRFRTERGYLRNVLGKEVPEQAAQSMERLTKQLLEKHDMKSSNLQHWIFHAGGEKILDAIENRLELSPDKLAASRNVLRDHGNMSSPTVLFALKEQLALHPPEPGERALMASFGAGFSVHGMIMEF